MAIARTSAETAPEARVLGVTAHASGLFGIAPPAAMYFLLRDDDEATAEQARLALNWQLTLVVLQVAVIIADVVLSSLAFGADALWAVSLLAWILLLPWALGAVVAVWAGIRMWRTGSWNYPWSIPFVGTGAAAKRRALLDVLDREDDEEEPIPLATLAMWFGVVGGVLGIVFGHLARGRIRRTGEAGWGAATLGLAVGYVEVAVTALLLAIVVLSWIALGP